MSNNRVRKLLLNPGPGTTSERVKQALLVSDICPRESEFGSLMKDIGEGLLQLGQAQSSYEVALFAASGTGAIEAMLGSAISLEDHVLISTNGDYGFRMKDICTSLKLSHDTFGSFGVL